MKIVVVENLSSDGQYRRGMILLNARLVGERRVAVLRHEAYHARFYEFTVVGRFLEVFRGRRVDVAYRLLLFLLWVVNPFVFLFALIPMFLAGVHEAVACIRYGGRLSLAMSFCGFLVCVVSFVVRLAFC